MSEKKGVPKWLIGCGVGCAGLALMLVVGGVVGVSWLKGKVENFTEAAELGEERDRRFGEPSDFVPWADGSIPADRLEAFLAIRQASQPSREEIAATFTELLRPETRDDLERKRGLEKWRALAGVMGSGVGLAPAIGRFYSSRNQAMLDQEMGLGEYTFLYVVAFHSWLGHSPADGLEELIEDSGPQVQVSVGDIGERAMRRKQHRDVTQMLANQLRALGDDGDPLWREMLSTELASMRADRDRLPWPDGPPDRAVASLEPFRERLAATYNPLTNEFELGRNKKRGGFGIQIE